MNTSRPEIAEPAAQPQSQGTDLSSLGHRAIDWFDSAKQAVKTELSDDSALAVRMAKSVNALEPVQALETSFMHNVHAVRESMGKGFDAFEKTAKSLNESTPLQFFETKVAENLHSLRFAAGEEAHKLTPIDKLPPIHLAEDEVRRGAYLFKEEAISSRLGQFLDKCEVVIQDKCKPFHDVPKPHHT